MTRRRRYLAALGMVAGPLAAAACAASSRGADTDLAGTSGALTAERGPSCRLTCGPPLRWAPPTLRRPSTVVVPSTGRARLKLDPSRDYVVRLGHRRGLVVIDGGRNVVIKGGRIEIPWQGADATAGERTALRLYNWVGTLHLEGVLIDGADLGEGINVQTSQRGILQLQNVRVEGMHARAHDFSSTHPDVIQTWSGPGEIRIDRLTGYTDYQGFFFGKDPKVSRSSYPGLVRMANVNLRPNNPTAHHLLWAVSPRTRFRFSNVFVSTGWYTPTYRRTLRDSIVVFDQDRSAKLVSVGNGRTRGSYVFWRGAGIAGRVRWGVPAGGDFVPRSRVGPLYVSPGYRRGAR